MEKYLKLRCGLGVLYVLMPFVSGTMTYVPETEEKPVQIRPTQGEVWPLPQAERKQDSYFAFSPTLFEFKIVNKRCDILDNAIIRYKVILRDLYSLSRRNRVKTSMKADMEHSQERDERYGGILGELLLNLTAPCEEYPSFKMDESYSLKIAFTGSLLTSDSIWGMLRGLETVSQLFYISDDFNEVLINCTEIFDFPHYLHRGLLLDTARHYISVSNILKTLDAMAINKMNVFHWHIVDDQSFPYQSGKFPELSNAGAFFRTMVYTKSNVELIVQYARERGIRVIPEFDMPGHTLSWGKSHPLILTKCYNRKGVVTRLGPMHPLRKSTYKLIRHLIEEVQRLFPEKYFHLGGDEVDFRCWQSNPDIRRFMTKNNLTAMEEVNAMFMSKVYHMLGNRSIPIFWQEVYDYGVHTPPDALIQVWKPQWEEKVAELVNQNISVIVSSPWYLDRLDNTFMDLYLNDPRSKMVSLVQKQFLSHIVGGEICMWGEKINDHNIHTRMWPRACAVAEVLWSVTGGGSAGAAAQEHLPRARLEEHACRLLRRAVPAAPPNGPGYCVT